MSTTTQAQLKTKKAYLEGKHDIMYRVQTSKGWSGWRSYFKADKDCSSTLGHLMWPWEMTGSPQISSVEWKLGKFPTKKLTSFQRYTLKEYGTWR